jgi:hypothetical protein
MNDVYRGMAVFIPSILAVTIMLWILWNLIQAGHRR